MDMLPKTMFEHIGVAPSAATLANAALVLLDVQEEYVSGALPLSGIEQALDEMSALLARARAAGTPVIHVLQDGKPGGLFDPAGEKARMIAATTPLPGEAVVSKKQPSAFTSQPFRDALVESGRRKIILTGFMSHLCVAATARAGFDHNMGVTIVARACATRDLPSPFGGVIPAQTLQEATLTALGDRIAAIAVGEADIPDA